MSSELNFSFDPAADIRPLLSPGENLLWSGNPKKGVVFRKSDAVVIPFSLFWFGFACAWEFMASKIEGGGYFKNLFMAFGSIFVIAGFIFAVGRFFIDARRRAGTTYGVTNSRIIIARSGMFSKSNESTDLKTINNLTFTQKDDGSGTIKFGSDINVPSFGRFQNFTVNMGNQSFEMIPNVKNVYDIISRQKDVK